MATPTAPGATQSAPGINPSISKSMRSLPRVSILLACTPTSSLVHRRFALRSISCLGGLVRRNGPARASALVTTLSTASSTDLRQILSGNDVRSGDGLVLTALSSLFDVTGEGVDERVNCTVGELGACRGDGQRPYQRWVHIDFAEVGKPVGHADGQDRRR
jgi:hypothetical protein